MDLTSKLFVVVLVLGFQPPVQAFRTCFESGGILVGPENARQCLKFSDKYLTWEGAKRACSAANEQLASLANPQAVFEYVNKTYGNAAFWVGGSNTKNEDTWKWLNGDLIENLPWAKGQPLGVKWHNCLGLDGANGYDDWRCTAKLRYICEISDCLDFSSKCEDWAYACESNKFYMHAFCRKTCKLCDQPPPSEFYTSTTELSIAKRTGTCEDRHDQCSIWEAVGECDANPNYMIKYCQKSCKKCGCPDGFLKVDGFNECFKIYDDVERSWEEAKKHCEAEGLRMAAPSHNITVTLRKELLNINNAGNDVWINARGNGTDIIWQDSDKVMESSNGLWLGGGHGGHTDAEHCAFILVSEGHWQQQPDRPYAVGFCSNPEHRFTLCQDI